ncbi:unnamed protein product [Notodromas monacha]|uniref:RNA polymerase II subunit A C-terminal domain phosphatase n=1 Tax=Notodromas monacha TaxID=399045 RepID=A0A7R9BHH4_9CRUS|nr:unnamed protein product [Notodromas monacha]CAG0914755.1 unnamed protein product [Notodromas monacha]
MAEIRVITFDEETPGVVVKWKIKPNYNVYNGMQVLFFRDAQAPENSDLKKLKIKVVGTVKELLVSPGDVMKPGASILTLEPCRHPTVMKEMCAECGADLQSTGETKTMTAAIPIVHNIPELMVSPEEAHTLGQEEEQRLLRERKLVLLVDLDQTLIHTTNDVIPPNVKDVFHYKLGGNPVWYHTRLRPHAREFLANVASLFELHICTFGARTYAHQIAYLLDKEGKYFSTRILSRDECFDPYLKTANMKALFPCGDHLVCIIDDREDVWNWVPNLVRVKPYHFFQHTGDINAPPGMAKADDDLRLTGVKLEDPDDTAKKDAPGSSTSRRIKNSPMKNKSRKRSGEEVPSENLPTKMEENGSDGDSSDDENSSSDSQNKSTEKLKASDTIEDCDLIDKKPIGKALLDSSIDNKAEKDAANEKPEGIAEPNSEGKGKILDPEDSDDYLLYLETILRRVHESFFSAYDAWLSNNLENGSKGPLPDLKSIVPEVKGRVLSGLNLVFSGVIPTRKPLKESAAYLVSTALGANVTENIVDDGPSRTTHLVASRYGTAKVHQVKKKPTISIVTPGWLWCCAERWEHVDERLFRLTKDNPSADAGPPVDFKLFRNHKPRRTDDDNSSDSAGSAVFDEGKNAFQDSLKNPYIMFSKEELDDMDKEVDEMCSSASSSSEDEDGESQDVTVVAERQKQRRKRLSRSLDVDEDEDIARIMDEEGTCSEEDDDDCNMGRRKRTKVNLGTTTDDSDVNAKLYPKERLMDGSSSEEDLDDDDTNDALDCLAHKLEEEMDHSY